MVKQSLQTNMSKTLKIIIAIVVVVLIVLALKPSPKGTGPIKIGFIAPLSGDGVVTIGESVRRGVELAATEINEKGGIDGRMIEVIYEDGKCSNKDATTAAQKLISIDKVKVIVGMICSGELLSAAPVAEAAKVVLIGQGSSPDITNAGDYVFRTHPSDVIVSQTLVDHMKANNFKKVAILSGSTAYTLALEKDFKVKAANNIEIVIAEQYTDNTKDFQSLLQKIKTTNPDAFLLNGRTPADAARIAQQARVLGITAQFYTAYFTAPEFVGLGKVVEGTYIADAPGLDPSNARAAAFLAKSKEKYGTEPAYTFFSVNAYDQVYLLAEIFKKASPEDADEIKKALYDTKAFNGVSGTFGFDANGDVTGIGMRMMQVKDGKAIPVQ